MDGKFFFLIIGSHPSAFTDLYFIVSLLQEVSIYFAYINYYIKAKNTF